MTQIKTPVKKHGASCQNCKNKFIIESEDFEFYRKIGVPAPTFCPECRAQRRYASWNLIEFYKRKCDFSGKEIISIYRPDSPFKVYDSKIWWSDKWDPMEYGQNYDFNQPFFEQYRELMLEVPRAHNLNINSVNCDYCAGAVNSKNCYLCVCNSCEDCAFSVAGMSKNCFDNFWILKSENCYENLFCVSSYNVHFSQFVDNCIDSVFLYDCRNCQNCFGCVNLRNKKYHIFNKPYSKADYQKEIKKYYLGSYNDLKKIKKQFEKFKSGFPRRFARIYKSYNVIGDNIQNTKNCHYCFNSYKGLEDCKYINSGGNNLRDSYDVFDGGTNAELLYESVTAGMNLRRVFFSVNIADSVYDIQYSDNCFSSSNLFGCISLRHKKHCILNKQYSKKEYEELVSKIKRYMDEMPYKDKKGRIYKYGEFFPIEFSPFDYNKSVAQEHFPLTKDEVIKQGYNWYDRPKSGLKPTKKSKDLPDSIKDTNESIFREVIECASSDCIGPGVFRIIPSEFKFYKRQNLPLPRLCPECRVLERYKKKNPSKLYHRKCQCAGHQSDPSTSSGFKYQNTIEHPHHKEKHCPNTFQTTYAPERKEIVYCEKCYLKELG